MITNRNSRTTTTTTTQVQQPMRSEGNAPISPGSNQSLRNQMKQTNISSTNTSLSSQIAIRREPMLARLENKDKAKDKAPVNKDGGDGDDGDDGDGDDDGDDDDDDSDQDSDYVDVDESGKNKSTSSNNKRTRSSRRPLRTAKDQDYAILLSDVTDDEGIQTRSKKRKNNDKVISVRQNNKKPPNDFNTLLDKIHSYSDYNSNRASTRALKNCFDSFSTAKLMEYAEIADKQIEHDKKVKTSREHEKENKMIADCKRINAIPTLANEPNLIINSTNREEINVLIAKYDKTERELKEILNGYALLHGVCRYKLELFDKTKNSKLYQELSKAINMYIKESLNNKYPDQQVNVHENIMDIQSNN
jgi:hypothetical protein